MRLLKLVPGVVLTLMIPAAAWAATPADAQSVRSAANKCLGDIRDDLLALAKEFPVLSGIDQGKIGNPFGEERDKIIWNLLIFEKGVQRTRINLNGKGPVPASPINETVRPGGILLRVAITSGGSAAYPNQVRLATLQFPTLVANPIVSLGTQDGKLQTKIEEVIYRRLYQLRDSLKGQ